MEAYEGAGAKANRLTGTMIINIESCWFSKMLISVVLSPCVSPCLSPIYPQTFYISIVPLFSFFFSPQSPYNPLIASLASFFRFPATLHHSHLLPARASNAPIRGLPLPAFLHYQQTANWSVPLLADGFSSMNKKEICLHTPFVATVTPELISPYLHVALWQVVQWRLNFTVSCLHIVLFTVAMCNLCIVLSRSYTSLFIYST